MLVAPVPLSSAWNVVVVDDVVVELLEMLVEETMHKGGRGG
jgi:hypothetical protein